MSSKSLVTQTDQSIQAAESVDRILGSGSSSVENVLSDALQVSSNEGELTINQFPQSVADAVNSLVGAVDKSVSGSLAAQMNATNVLGSKLESLSQGDASVLPKLMLYGVIGIAVIVLGRKYLK